MSTGEQPVVSSCCIYGRERQARVVWASLGIQNHHTVGGVLPTVRRLFFADDLRRRVPSAGHMGANHNMDIYVVRSTPASCCRL